MPMGAWTRYDGDGCRFDVMVLLQAKELVEGAPKILKKDVKKEEAKKLVEKLKEVGAKVELV